MTKIIAMLMLAVATLATAVQAAEPSSFKSLQPFQSFAKGEGVGVAYEYKNRTKAQFVALLRDKGLAKKEMRVTCEVLVRQIVEAHPSLPFEGCEGAAAAIENDSNFAAVACRDEMFQRDNWLIVTNKVSSAFGVWHRKCLPDEKVLVYKNQPIVSLMCLNGSIPVPVIPVATGVCPNGYTLTMNAWSLQSFPDAIRKKAMGLIAAAESRDSQNAMNVEAYKADDLSRTLGAQLRREVKIRAPVTTDVTVRYVDVDSQTNKVVTRDIGVVRVVNGTGTFRFPDDPRKHVAVGTVWPANFISPTTSGGERRLRVFPGEWENWCALNVHGLVP